MRRVTVVPLRAPWGANAGIDRGASRTGTRSRRATGSVLTFSLGAAAAAAAAAGAAVGAAAAADTNTEVGRGQSGGKEPDQQRRRAARLHDDQGGRHGDGGCHGAELAAWRYRRVSDGAHTSQRSLFCF